MTAEKLPVSRKIRTRGRLLGEAGPANRREGPKKVPLQPS